MPIRLFTGQEGTRREGSIIEEGSKFRSAGLLRYVAARKIHPFVGHAANTVRRFASAKRRENRFVEFSSGIRWPVPSVSHLPPSPPSPSSPPLPLPPPISNNLNLEALLNPSGLPVTGMWPSNSVPSDRSIEITWQNNAG